MPDIRELFFKPLRDFQIIEKDPRWAKKTDAEKFSIRHRFWRDRVIKSPLMQRVYKLDPEAAEIISRRFFEKESVKAFKASNQIHEPTFFERPLINVPDTFDPAGKYGPIEAFTRATGQTAGDFLEFFTTPEAIAVIGGAGLGTALSGGTLGPVLGTGVASYFAAKYGIPAARQIAGGDYDIKKGATRIARLPFTAAYALGYDPAATYASTPEEFEETSSGLGLSMLLGAGVRGGYKHGKSKQFKGELRKTFSPIRQQLEKLAGRRLKPEEMLRLLRNEEVELSPKDLQKAKLVEFKEEFGREPYREEVTRLKEGTEVLDLIEEATRPKGVAPEPPAAKQPTKITPSDVGLAFEEVTKPAEAPKSPLAVDQARLKDLKTKSFKNLSPDEQIERLNLEVQYPKAKDTQQTLVNKHKRLRQLRAKQKGETGRLDPAQVRQRGLQEELARSQREGKADEPVLQEFAKKDLDKRASAVLEVQKKFDALEALDEQLSVKVHRRPISEEQRTGLEQQRQALEMETIRSLSEDLAPIKKEGKAFDFNIVPEPASAAKFYSEFAASLRGALASHTRAKGLRETLKSETLSAEERASIHKQLGDEYTSEVTARMRPGLESSEFHRQALQYDKAGFLRAVGSMMAGKDPVFKTPKEAQALADRVRKVTGPHVQIRVLTSQSRRGNIKGAKFPTINVEMSRKIAGKKLQRSYTVREVERLASEAERKARRYENFQRALTGELPQPVTAPRVPLKERLKGEKGAVDVKELVGGVKELIKKARRKGRFSFGTSKEKSPAFYSHIEKVVEEKMPGVAEAEQVARMLRKAGANIDELKWIGLDDFLGEKISKGERVSKVELQEFLKQNRLQLEETTKGMPPEGIRHDLLNDERARLLVEQEQLLSQLRTQSRGEALGPDRGELQRRGREVNSRLEAVRNSLIDEETGAQFETYTLPGGKNYREVFMRLLETKRVETKRPYLDPHGDPPNTVVRLRLKDRVDVNGRWTLFIEEIQSGWAQDLRSLREGIVGAFRNAPEMPFTKTWHELALKRILRMAAEEGYDQIAWTTGLQQANRYDLRHQVRDIRYIKRPDGRFDIRASSEGGGNINVGDLIPPERLSNYVGEGVAQQIIEGRGTHPGTVGMGWNIIERSQLEIGGEAHIRFYDQMIPQYLKRYGKKWGAKPGQTQIATDITRGDTPFHSLRFDLGARTTVHSMPITPEMKASVLVGQRVMGGAFKFGQEPLNRLADFAKKKIGRLRDKGERLKEEKGELKIDLAFLNKIREKLAGKAESPERNVQDIKGAIKIMAPDQLKSYSNFFKFNLDALQDLKEMSPIAEYILQDPKKIPLYKAVGDAMKHPDFLNIRNIDKWIDNIQKQGINMHEFRQLMEFTMSEWGKVGADWQKLQRALHKHNINLADVEQPTWLERGFENIRRGDDIRRAALISQFVTAARNAYVEFPVVFTKIGSEGFAGLLDRFTIKSIYGDLYEAFDKKTGRLIHGFIPKDVYNVFDKTGVKIQKIFRGPDLEKVRKKHPDWTFEPVENSVETLSQRHKDWGFRPAGAQSINQSLQHSIQLWNSLWRQSYRSIRSPKQTPRSEMQLSFFDPEVRALLERLPHQVEHVFSFVDPDVQMKGRFGSAANKLIRGLTYFNRWQEFNFRRVFLEASLKAEIKRRGINPENLENLPLERVKEIVLPALEDAMRRTFADSPKSTVGKGLLKLYDQGRPFTTAFHPFMRFAINSMKYVTRHSPAIAFSPYHWTKIYRLLNSGRPADVLVASRILSEGLVGMVFVGIAYLAAESKYGGPKWNLYYDPETRRPIWNWKPFMPIGLYPYFGHVMKRAREHARAVKETRAETGVETGAATYTVDHVAGLASEIFSKDSLDALVSLNRMAGSGLIFVELLLNGDRVLPRDPVQKDQEITNLSKEFFGSYFGGFTTPVRMLRDVFALWNSDNQEVPSARSEPFIGNLVRSFPNEVQRLMGREPLQTAASPTKGYFPPIPDVGPFPGSTFRQIVPLHTSQEADRLRYEIDRLVEDQKAQYSTFFPARTGNRVIDELKTRFFGEFMNKAGQHLEKPDSEFGDLPDDLRKEYIALMARMAKQFANLQTWAHINKALKASGKPPLHYPQVLSREEAKNLRAVGVGLPELDMQEILRFENEKKNGRP